MECFLQDGQQAIAAALTLYHDLVAHKWGNLVGDLSALVQASQVTIQECYKSDHLHEIEATTMKVVELLKDPKHAVITIGKNALAHLIDLAKDIQDAVISIKNGSAYAGGHSIGDALNLLLLAGETVAAPTPEDMIAGTEGFLEGFYKVDFVKADAECFLKDGQEVAESALKLYNDLKAHQWASIVGDVSAVVQAS